jgi:hypothetical protein
MHDGPRRVEDGLGHGAEQRHDRAEAEQPGPEVAQQLDRRSGHEGLTPARRCRRPRAAPATRTPSTTPPTRISRPRRAQYDQQGHAQQPPALPLGQGPGLEQPELVVDEAHRRGHRQAQGQPEQQAGGEETHRRRRWRWPAACPLSPAPPGPRWRPAPPPAARSRTRRSSPAPARPAAAGSATSRATRSAGKPRPTGRALSTARNTAAQNTAFTKTTTASTSMLKAVRAPDWVASSVPAPPDPDSAPSSGHGQLHQLRHFRPHGQEAQAPPGSITATIRATAQPTTARGLRPITPKPAVAASVTEKLAMSPPRLARREGLAHASTVHEVSLSDSRGYRARPWIRIRLISPSTSSAAAWPARKPPGRSPRPACPSSCTRCARRVRRHRRPPDRRPGRAGLLQLVPLGRLAAQRRRPAARRDAQAGLDDHVLRPTQHQVPAGGALAVDRDNFSAEVTRRWKPIRWSPSCARRSPACRPRSGTMSSSPPAPSPRRPWPRRSWS